MTNITLAPTGDRYASPMDPIILLATMIGVWVLIALWIAFYAQAAGYAFWPLLIIGLVFGPIGWGAILLVVTVGTRQRSIS